MFLSIDSGCSRISSSGTTQWVCRRRLLVLIVGAPGSPILAPPRGARRRRFLVLMVGALGSPAPAPPTGPTTDALQLSGSHF
jgi:hypothetical protein